MATANKTMSATKVVIPCRINTPLTVALSWIVLSIVQNGETMGVREGKTSVN